MFKFDLTAIDIDGVIVNFVATIGKICGKGSNWTTNEWIDEKNCERLLECRYEELLNKINSHEFYDNCVFNLDTFDMVIFLKEMSYNLVFLTSPYAFGRLMSNSYVAKQDLVKRYFSSSHTYFVQDKYWMAGNNRLLIDDCKTNVTFWKSHGGIAYLYKTQHNKDLKESMDWIDIKHKIMGVS